MPESDRSPEETPFYKRKNKMRKVNWLLVGIISFVILLILLGTGMLMGDWGYRAWGMMGPQGMTENWANSPLPSPLGLIGMIFMWLFPVGLIALGIFGIVWLVRNASHSKP
jgi:hypothetical protein